MTGIPEAELTQMLGTNALRCYGLDPAPLYAIAAQVGPEKSLFVGAPDTAHAKHAEQAQ
jgi:hypothetical protein